MWSGGISGRNRVRPAGKWARGLTCQTAKTPACHIQFVMPSFFLSICLELSGNLLSNCLFWNYKIDMAHQILRGI